MKTVSQILDERLYNKDDSDPRALFYRTTCGKEYEVPEDLALELRVDFGHCTEDYLFMETDLTLDQFIELKACPD